MHRLALALAAAILAAAPSAGQTLGAQPSRWWQEVDRIGGLLEGGRWAKVEKQAAALFSEHPLRRAGEYPPGRPPVELRPDRDFRPATAPSFQVAPLDNYVAAHESVAPVRFEVFVAPDGRISQPVVVTDWSNPVVVQWGLDGEPVGWLAPVELTLSNRPAKRW